MRSVAVWALLSSAAVVVDGLKVSTNARCGSGYSLTCQGSQFGNCCSQYGYCGSTTAYCQQGCQSGYGICTGQSSTPLSTNARCGSGFGYTCQNSKWGNCCSQYGYCGSSSSYCGGGCQNGFGQCNGQSSSTSSSSAGSSITSRSSSSTSVAAPSTTSSRSSSTSTLTSASSSSSSVAPSSSSSVVSSSSTSASSTSSSTPTSGCANPQTNVLINPSYETTTAPWQISGNSDYVEVSDATGGAHQGNNFYAATINPTGSRAASFTIYVYQTVTFLADARVTLSVWVQATAPVSGSNNFDYNLLIDNSNTITVAGESSVGGFPSGNPWFQLSGTASIPAGTHQIGMQVVVYGGGISQIIGIDDWTATASQPVCIQNPT